MIGGSGSGPATFNDRFGFSPFNPFTKAPSELFGGAARVMVPSSQPSSPPAGKQSSLGSRGALAMDNWQSSRVTNLVVRNVPGSNIFMSANSMNG
jgi:hypothetical protein